jgi:hypothetical protein
LDGGGAGGAGGVSVVAAAAGAEAGESDLTGLETTRGAVVPGAAADVVGEPVGRLLMRRGARASPLVERAGAEDEMVLPVDLFSGAGSGGGGGSSAVTTRRRPSASALRRTRSACASSMEDEWLFTPMPRDRARSRPSLLVRPSSLASS